MTDILCSLCVLTICFSHTNIHTAHIQYNPSSLSVRSAPYTALCSSLSPTCYLYQTLCFVQYHSYSTVYTVTICSASTGG